MSRMRQRVNSKAGIHIQDFLICKPTCFLGFTRLGWGGGGGEELPLTPELFDERKFPNFSSLKLS